MVRTRAEGYAVARVGGGEDDPSPHVTGALAMNFGAARAFLVRVANPALAGALAAEEGAVEADLLTDCSPISRVVTVINRHQLIIAVWRLMVEGFELRLSRMRRPP